MAGRSVLVGIVAIGMSGIAAPPSAGVTWEFAAPLNTARQGAGAALGDDGLIYATGGAAKTAVGSPLNYFTSVEKYDPVANIWSEGPSMNVARWGHGVVSTGGLIYAIGGMNSIGVERRMETLDVTAGTWQPSRYALNVGRRSLGVTVDHAGRIYAIGGSDESGVRLASVEVFDPAVNPANPAVPPGPGWQMLGYNLNWGRDSLGAGTDALGRIFAVSGIAGVSLTNTVEMFDPSNPSAGWTFGPSVNQNRQAGGYATGADGAIYILGGWTSHHYLSSVEMFDLSSNSWVMHSNMNRGTNCFGAAFDPSGRLYAVGGETIVGGSGGFALDGVERTPEPASSGFALLGLAVLTSLRRRR